MNRPSIWLMALWGIAGLSGLVLAELALPGATQPPERPSQDADVSPRFKTGQDFRRALTERMSITWDNRPFRDAILGLTYRSGVALLLDRRIDPSEPIRFHAADLTVGELLDSVARKRQARTTVVGHILYIGPPSSANQVRGLIQLREAELTGLLPLRRQLLQRASTLTWEDLESPQEVLHRVAQHYELKLQGLDGLPWDLWAGATLPQTTAVEQLSLILTQFDRTFRWQPDGTGIQIVPITAEERLQATAGQAEKAQSPSRTDTQRTRTLSGRQQRITGQVNNRPLSEVFSTLEAQTGYQFVIDAQALQHKNVSLEAPISFQVKDATLAEVLHIILDPLEVSFEIIGRYVYIPARPRRQ